MKDIATQAIPEVAVAGKAFLQTWTVIRDTPEFPGAEPDEPAFLQEDQLAADIEALNKLDDNLWAERFCLLVQRSLRFLRSPLEVNYVKKAGRAWMEAESLAQRARDLALERGVESQLTEAMVANVLAYFKHQQELYRQLRAGQVPERPAATA